MKSIRTLLVTLTIFIPLFGQIAGKLPTFSREGLGYDLSASQSSAAFLDWSRWQMQHSVSMSMGSSSLGSASYLTYQNRFYMPLSSRLSFYGNMYWQMQTHASNPVLQRIGSPLGAVYFDANLQYQLAENSTISLGISYLPSDYGYYGYSPYYSPYYRMMQGRPGGLWP